MTTFGSSGSCQSAAAAGSVGEIIGCYAHLSTG